MASTSASGSKRKAACIDAFDELAPSSSASSSSSASTPMKRPFYDVFLNHRGPDVKSTIATALYAMLTQRHLSVFLDESELEYGDFFPHTLQAAMSSAQVYVAIISERYVESPWCLAELSFMVKSGAPNIPIFYDVDPTDLRWVDQRKGKNVDAFEGYLQKNRYLGKLNEWKTALYKASFYKGEVIQNKEQVPHTRPENIGQLSKLRQMFIEHALLTSLPTSLRWLSSLTNLHIIDCPEMKCLPESLGDLSSLTELRISHCPELDRVGEKSVAKAIRQLSNLQSLSIYKCPISGSSLSFGSSSLKYIDLEETEVCRISCSTHLETLSVQANRHLEEIEALPMTLESIYLQDCEMLKKIAGLARSTSLREFHLEGCNRIVKIEGIENCIGLEKLSIESRMEVPGIERLEHLRNLRELKLSANKGAVIERCIQRIQGWPSESTIICARAVPDAA